MKMFRLYIGTTDGPTEIQRVTPEDPEVRSVVCLDGKAIALPISDDYDAFVRRPTGIVETLTGHPAYRVDITHPIGGGYSWQLGIAVAHILSGRGCLAGPEDRAEDALWLTGEVDHNLNIGAVNDVGLKLTRATSMLKGLLAEGVCVTVAVPDACADEARGALAVASPMPKRRHGWLRRTILTKFYPPSARHGARENFRYGASRSRPAGDRWAAWPWRRRFLPPSW